jgi:hypothetical protein
MGLYPPCSTATTLASLNAAGIAIVQENQGWFIKSHRQIAGPYATAEAALEASMSGFSEINTRQVGEDISDHRD